MGKSHPPECQYRISTCQWPEESRVCPILGGVSQTSGPFLILVAANNRHHLAWLTSIKLIDITCSLQISDK
jgi:hypothetical protein